MKVCLVAHGYPPELVGGTETAVRNLAHGLVRRGHEVVVVAGSMQHDQGFRTSEARDEVEGGGSVEVIRIHRADLYFDHWQKSLSGRVGQAFGEILARVKPDLVHVHHWIRLTRDLVHRAACAGVPSLVTLHDLWTSCLITFRVRPESGEFCEATLAPHPCLDCANHFPPRTPFVERENLYLAFAERKADLLRELQLARAVLVPSHAHADAARRFLGLADDALAVRVVPHGRELTLARRTPPPLEGRLVIGAWGHLHPLKGPDLLLRAVRALPDPGRVTLHFAGGEVLPEYTQQLHALAEGLDVHFHGPYAADRLDEHPVSDVHVMVSATRAHESWGLILDEACAMGVPMVLPGTGAYAERMREGNGVLFYDPKQEGALTAVLQRLLDEADLAPRLAASLPELGELVPGTDLNLERTLAVYDEVLAAGAVPETSLDWWRDKMAIANEEAWDQGLAATPPEELGLA